MIHRSRHVLIPHLLVLMSAVGLAGHLGCAAPAPAPSFVEIPFEFERNCVILQVQVNGHGPFSMLLDTGTDPSAIDLAMAREIGLSIDSVDVGGEGTGSETIVSHQTVLPTVQVGDLKATNVAALSGEQLSRISERLGRPIKGVLGYSFLADRIVQFDYARQRIRFYSSSPYPGRSEEAKERVTLPFELWDSTPMIDEVLVDGKKIKATLDTGSNGTIRLTARAITSLGLQEVAEKAAPMTATGYAGKAQYRKGQLESLGIGRMVVADPAVTFVMEARDEPNGTPEGNMGNAFMSHFTVTFDYPGHLVTFER